ncbi:hypothetical protein Lal_00035441 [Lupinus albus]|nr:hypothetical protein Lal_00035441 [Lupinus albus]
MEPKSWKSQGKRFSEKEKLAKKPLRSSISVALKGKSSENTLLGECCFKASSSKTIYHPPPSFSNPDNTKKKVLSNWKQMKISMTIWIR